MALPEIGRSALLAFCGVLGSAACGQTVSQPLPSPTTVVAQALGLIPLQRQLASLQQQDQGTTGLAVALRLQILERVLRASFDVDAVLGRIDTEASYMSEDQHALQVRSQHENALLNLTTIAASGALGAAGSAMQLTRGLNHAGTALQAASGGTAILLSAVQLKGLSGGKHLVRSPYNMLAPLLDRPPNAESIYPPVILAYLQTSPSEGHQPVAEGLVAAWHRLHRLQSSSKDQGISPEDAIVDRAADRKLNADEIANREAMLHDLHAAIILMRLDLQKILIAEEGSATSSSTP